MKSRKKITRDDVFSHLHIVCKPENTDPLQKWIGSYNLYRGFLLHTSNGFFIELEQSDRPNPILLRIYRNSKERSNLPYIRIELPCCVRLHKGLNYIDHMTPKSWSSTNRE